MKDAATKGSGKKKKGKKGFPFPHKTPQKGKKIAGFSKKTKRPSEPVNRADAAYSKMMG